MNKSLIYGFLFLFAGIKLQAQLTVTTAGSLNVARWMHESQVLPNGNVIAFGGDNGNLLSTVVLKSAEIYNPGSNSWSLAADMAKERTDFASAILHDGRVMAIGGSDQSFTTLSSCEVYDYNTNSWTSLASLNEPRAYHKAVKLKDGRVLVVGGNSNTNTAEVYDPYSNTWQYTDTLNKRHGSGIAATLLIDGRVLVTGGTGASNVLEIYNPVNNSWTQVGNNLITGRSYHNMSVMTDGTVFITAGESTHKKTEMFIPSTSQIFSNGNLQTTFGDCKTIVMDDGKVLIYGIGDFSAPSNTKCLETLSSPSYTWTAGTYNFAGADNYCINKLRNGQVLINGGSFTTGNGATTNCKLIGIASYSGCVLPNLNLTLGVTNVCYGKTPTVTVQASEAGVSYSVAIGGVVVSTGVNGNGSNINLSIPASVIQPGNNIVSVIARKGGCHSYYLNSNAIINSTLSITGTPTITPGGTLLICAGDSIQLNASAGYSSYMWSNLTGTTTASSIYVKPNKTLTVKYVDANGCTSVPSFFSKVYTPSAAYAGPLVSTCDNASPFQLVGNSPPGGLWTGTGVSSTGVFTPPAIGSYTLTYSICTKTANRVIKVYPAVVPTYSASFTATSVCAGQSNTLQIFNSSIGVKYQLRNGTTLLGSSQTGTGGTLNFATGTGLISSAKLNMLCVTTTTCGVDTLIRDHYVLVKPSYNTKITVRDSLICLGQTALIVVDSAQLGVNYQLQTLSGTNMYSPKTGDGDSIAIRVGPINTYSVFNVRAYYPGCSYVNTTFHPAVNVQRPYVYFAPNKFNVQPNEYIKFNNNSPIISGNFNWNFEATASIPTSTLTVPDSIYYSVPGTKQITLNTITSLGCKDSLTQTINVFNALPNACPAGRGAFQGTGYEVFSLNNDKDDNTYAFMNTASTNKTMAFSVNNDTLKRFLPYDINLGYSHGIIKYNRFGIPQWNVKIRHNSPWARPGNVDFDSLGNVYFTYYHGDYLSAIYFYSVDNSYVRFFPPATSTDESVIICKYSPDGYFQWVKTYLENSTSASALKVDPAGFIYAGSDRHYNKFDTNGNLVWAINSVAPMNGGVRSIAVDTIGNSYVLKTLLINVDQYDAAGNIVFSTDPYISLATSSQTESSELKMENQNVYMAGIFKGKIKFAGDTFFVNKDPGLMYTDGYVASSNRITGQQRWFIQVKCKGNYFVMYGMDFKNGKGSVLAQVVSPGDTIWVKNLMLPMPNGGLFSFDFDSLGNASNLVSVTPTNASTYNLPKHLVARNYLDTNSTYGVMYANTMSYGAYNYPQVAGCKNFIILKGDISCLSSIVTGQQTSQPATIDQLNVILYPNPKNNNQELKLDLLTDKQEKIRLTLTDISGRIIAKEMTFDLNAGENTISLPAANELNTGIYFLNVKADNINKTIKLLVN